MKIREKIKVVIQARSNSKRFYNKVLNNILGKPLIQICFDRVIYSKLYKAVVATSSDFEDDLLSKFLKKNKIPFYRSSLNDVLKRFIYSTKDLTCDTSIVVRLTADNPLVDKNLIHTCLKIFIKNKLNYFSSHDNIVNIPRGLQVEIFRIGELRKIYKSNYNNLDKEHVTFSLRKKFLNKKIKIKSIFSKKHKSVNVSIDTMSDLLRVKKLFIYKKNKLSSNFQNINYFKKNPSKNLIKKSNLAVGTVQIGKKYFHSHKITQKRAFDILDYAYKKNFNILDTARDYGSSEKFIGNYFKIKDKCFLICSKLQSLGNTKLKSETISKVNKSIFESLSNLNISYFDFFLIHDPNDLKNKYLINHLAKFVKSGIIKNLGVSLYEAKDFNKIKKIKLIKSLQIPINLIDHRLINLLNKKNRYTIFARSILLRGKIKKNTIKFPQNDHTFNKIFNLLSKYNENNFLDLAISFVKSFKNIKYFIFGFNKKSQINEIVNIFLNYNLKLKKRNLIIKKIASYELSKKVDLRYW